MLNNLRITEKRALAKTIFYCYNEPEIDIFTIMFNGEKNPNPPEVPDKETRKYGRNINDWAEAIRDTNPDLSERLDENRMRGFESVERLGLPRYKRKTLSLADFFKNPAEAFAGLESNLFYIVLIPRKSGLRRFSRTAVTPEQVAQFISQKIEPELISQYDIVINQHFENLYGGGIVVNREGQVYIEFRSGDYGQIGNGLQAPEFYVQSDPVHNSLKYSFEDAPLRKLIYDTLNKIPHERDGHEVKYQPGYYEFAIVKKDEHSPAKPAFVDYKDNPTFELPDNPDYEIDAQ